MNNPLFGMMNQNLLQKFQQFQKTFHGNPQDQIRNLMASGRVSQQQYNQAMQMAQQMRQMLGK